MQNREIIAHLNNLGMMTKNQDELIKKEPSTPRYPVKVSFAINKNKKSLAEAYKDYQTSFNELLNKYSLEMKDDKINLEKLDKETRTKCISDMNDLINIDVEVSVHKIDEDAFGAYEPSLSELECLSFMMEV